MAPSDVCKACFREGVSGGKHPGVQHLWVAPYTKERPKKGKGRGRAAAEMVKQEEETDKMRSHSLTDPLEKQQIMSGVAVADEAEHRVAEGGSSTLGGGVCRTLDVLQRGVFCY